MCVCDQQQHVLNYCNPSTVYAMNVIPADSDIEIVKLTLHSSKVFMQSTSDYDAEKDGFAPTKFFLPQNQRIHVES